MCVCEKNTPRYFQVTPSSSWNWVNTIAADVLAPCVSRASTAIVITVCDKHVLVCKRWYPSIILLCHYCEMLKHTFNIVSDPVLEIILTLQWRHNERNDVYPTVCSGTYQRKHQSSASLAFVMGIHRWPVDSLTKGQSPGNAESVSIWWRHHEPALSLWPG